MHASPFAVPGLNGAKQRVWLLGYKDEPDTIPTLEGAFRISKFSQE